MRSAPSNPRHTNTSPFRVASEDAAKSAYLLPKDRCDCQRSRPSRTGAPHLARHWADKGQPRIAAGQRTGARRHRIWDSQPHGPSLPKARDDTRGHHRPGLEGATAPLREA
jgi:hypothetical protein